MISSYTQAQDEGLTHYIFPEFTEGLVLMKAGAKNEAMLNYNSLTEEMIFEKNSKKMAISKIELELIDTVYIKDRKFIGLNGKFVELLKHSEWDLYLEHKCKAEAPGKPSGYGGTSKTTAITTQATLYSQGSVYELKLPNTYEIEPYSYYWLKKNGELKRFISMRDFKKFYKDKPDLYKTYVKLHGIKYKNQEGIVQLIEHMESN